MSFRYVNKILLANVILDMSTKFDLEMSFRYVNKIQLGDVF